MKKTLLLILTMFSLAMIVPTKQAEAQFNNFSLKSTAGAAKTSTSSGADTIIGTLSYPASLVTSATVTMAGLSGTAGRIVMMGSNKQNTYTRLDSVTVSYIGGNSTKDWDFNKVTSPTKFPDAPAFLWYQFIYYQTAGSVSGATGVGLVRSSPK